MNDSVPAQRRELRTGDRVIVVGAGPAGLTAAYLLAKEGVAVTVLEGDDSVGGLSRTVEYHGYRFDIGGHRFFTTFPPVEALWEEILGSEMISVPRQSRIYYQGQFFDYPLKPLNALRQLGLWQSLQVVGSYLRSQVSPCREEVNFEQWVSNRFGRRLYEIFFKSYTEKVWGMSCTDISAEWAAQRIQNLSLARAIAEAVPLTLRPTAIRSMIREFRYPRLGPGQLWERCRDRVLEMGGEILMQHHVQAVQTTDGQFTSVAVRTPQGTRVVEGEHCISTMAIRSLVSGLWPRAPADVLKAGRSLNYREFITVALILREPSPFSDNWIYVHSPEVRVGRIQNFNNWSTAMVPVPGRTCLGMEYFCSRGDDLSASRDEDLIALAGFELGKLGLGDPSRIEDAAVVRMPKAYPVYDGSYRTHLKTIRAHIDPITNLHLVGRNGMHKYNNQDHSMLTAMMAVANMRGARHNVWDVNTDYEYHEELRLTEDGGAPRSAASAVEEAFG
jgi:protoporphyrinogen oxidase